MKKETDKGIKKPAGGGVEPLEIAKGVINAYIMTIPVFVIFALILSYTDFPIKYIPLAVLVSTVASLIYAGLKSARTTKEKGWINGCIIGFVYILLLYLLSSIVYKDFSVDRYILTMAFIAVLSGAIGGILGVNTGAGGKKGTRKRRRALFNSR